MSTRDIDEILRRKYAEENARVVEAVLAAPMTTTERTLAVELALTEPLRIWVREGEGYELTRLHVSTTHFPYPPDEDDDGAPHVEIRGFGRTLTTKGEPDKREAPLWRQWLPRDLAAPLIGRAMVG